MEDNYNDESIEMTVCSECGERFDATLTECPQCGCPVDQEPDVDEAALEEVEEDCSFCMALSVFFRRIAYVLFVLPYKVWKAAVDRLAMMDSECLCLGCIKNEWPLLTLLKRFVLDFAFDALAMISWLAVVFFAIDHLCYCNATICSWICGIYMCYLLPVVVVLAKDLVMFLFRNPIRCLKRACCRRMEKTEE